MSATCPACAEPAADVFHEQRRIPAHSVMLFDSREAALAYPRGDLRLVHCGACGFIFNKAFDETLNEYSQRCEESQGFSPHFRSWMEAVAKEFVDRYDLHDRSVLEIGCGKGEFLALVCELGHNLGVGVDPAYVPGRLDSPALDRLTFINELYTSEHGDLAGDAVICRHTLEHIAPVAEFVATIRRSLADRSSVIVFFELPETLRVLREVAFWDLYYEHCSYFTPGSLARLFRREGFDLERLRLEFDEQYILLDARPGDGSGPELPLEDDLAETADLVATFRREFPQRIQALREIVDQRHDRGERTVVWGGGSKGVSFLTTLGITGEIDYVVDINPYKQGKFMAGTGHEVVAPERLVEHRPDLVLVMNPIYEDEIAQELARLGLTPDLVPV